MMRALGRRPAAAAAPAAPPTRPRLERARPLHCPAPAASAPLRECCPPADAAGTVNAQGPGTNPGGPVWPSKGLSKHVCKTCLVDCTACSRLEPDKLAGITATFHQRATAISHRSRTVTRPHTPQHLIEQHHACSPFSFQSDGCRQRAHPCGRRRGPSGHRRVRGGSRVLELLNTP